MGYDNWDLVMQNQYFDKKLNLEKSMETLFWKHYFENVGKR